jgi:hypothetical protein
VAIFSASLSATDDSTTAAKRLGVKKTTVRKLRGIAGLVAASGSKEMNAVEPPPNGFTFILACTARPNRADEVLGDAETEYRRMLVRLGPRLARWWYRIYVVRVMVWTLPGVLMRVGVLHKLFHN